MAGATWASVATGAAWAFAGVKAGTGQTTTNAVKSANAVKAEYYFQSLRKFMAASLFVGERPTNMICVPGWPK